jgi:hypothetical protein
MSGSARTSPRYFYGLTHSYMNTYKLSPFRILMASLVLASGIASAQQLPSLSPNHLVFDSTAKAIDLRWLADTVHTRVEPYAALLIPVRLKNCPVRFYMQFDLGAPSSILYRDKIRQIRKKYPSAITSLDTVALTDVTLQLGEVPILAKKIELIEHGRSSIRWNDKNSMTIIGTVGADLIDGRVAILDYRAIKLTITNKIPTTLSAQLVLTDMVFAQRRVLLPATLEKKEIMVFFDTGSSAYELLSDRETAEMLATDTVVQTSEVTSWNRTLRAHTVNTSRTITLAGKALPLQHITYMEGVTSTQLAHMKRLGIGGMIGNKILLNTILVLDTQHKKFGVITAQ